MVGTPLLRNVGISPQFFPPQPPPRLTAGTVEPQTDHRLEEKKGGKGVTNCFGRCRRSLGNSMESQTLDAPWFWSEKGDADTDQADQVGGRQK
jgi:hypothetical protein